VFGPEYVIIEARQLDVAQVGTVREALMKAGAPSRPEPVTNEGLNRWPPVLVTVLVLNTVDPTFVSRYQRITGAVPEAMVWMFQIRFRDWMLALWKRPSRLSSFCPFGWTASGGTAQVAMA
jgi:hypothetical protein